MEKSIAILTCWYGEYPWYFPYFIHSCVYNPSVDFNLQYKYFFNNLNFLK